jgi:rhamnogalacturonan hydrolase
MLIQNWYGYNNDYARPVIYLRCNESVPCTNIDLSDLAIWTDDGDYVDWECENVYGSGYCIESTSTGAYTTVAKQTTVKYVYP